MIKDEEDEVIKKCFKSPKIGHQNTLVSMWGSEFVFDFIQLIYYRYNKINPNCGRSYIDSSHWIKKQAINNKCLSTRSNSHVKSWKNK